MPRFVVLTHDHPLLHWDFMLEFGESLRTWRLSRPPAAHKEITAEPLADHRPAYLNHEGPVSGGRGEVQRWDAGEYALLEESPTRLSVRLHGQKLDGIAMIEQPEAGAAGTFYFTAD